MQTKYLTRIFAILLAILTFAACDRSKEEEPSTDPRDVFVGDYSFESVGSIDLYAGLVKVVTVPMDQKGELSIVPGDKDDMVWIIASGDTALAYVHDNQLLMEPASEEATIGELVMELSYTYSTATLKDNRISFSSEVEITASYKEHILSGIGTVDIVATKK